MFQKLKEVLTLELSNELPGEEAHNIMMPTARDTNFVFPKFKSSPTTSAVLILFYKDETGKVKFPLIQRPKYNGAHSGQVSFPGGKSEPTDPDLIFTALREANEEIGIDMNAVQVIGNLSDLFISVSNFQVTPVVGFMEERPVFKREPLEVDSIIEADMYDIMDPQKRTKGTIIVREKFKIKTPYFLIDNRIVWGATAMMLSELSVVIGKSGIYQSNDYGA